MIPANITRLMTFAQYGEPKLYAASDMMRADLEALILAAVRGTEPSWGITPATKLRHVSPGIPLGHELHRLQAYDAAAQRETVDKAAAVGYLSIDPEIIRGGEAAG